MTKTTGPDRPVAPGRREIARTNYPLLFETDERPIAILGLDFVVLDVNAAFEREIALCRDKARGTVVYDLWGLDVDALETEIQGRIDAMGVYAVDAQPVSPGPGVPPARLSFTAIVSDDGQRIAYTLAPVTEHASLWQRQLSLEAEGLQRAFDQMAVGMMLTGMDGFAIRCNAAMVKLLGRTHDEIAKTEAVAMIFPDDRDRVIDQATRLIVGELDSYSQEIRLLAGDGVPVWVQETANCVRDGHGRPLHFVTQFVDIRARKEAEEALQKSQATINFLFEGNPSPIVELDQRLRICAGNAALARFLGYEAIGRSITDVVHPDDLDRLMAMDAGRPDDELVVEFRVLRADGDARLVRSHGRVHRGDRGAFRSVIATWHDVTEAKEQEALLRRQASTDPLTGLPHRATFMDELTSVVDRSTAPNQVAILFVDLDHFKPINDRYGHQAGDHVLRQVGDRIRSCVRGTDTVARIGGDEFVVLVNLTAPGADAEAIGRRIVDRVAEPYETHFGHLTVSASVGLAYGGIGSDTLEMVHRADLAAYTAKSTGGSNLAIAEV